MNPIRRRSLSGVSAFRPPQWASLQFWFSADNGTFSDTGLVTPVTTDGTAVGGWQDRGPFGNNATQGTAGKRPTLKTSGLNGHATVLFASASTQWLSVDAAAAAFSGSNLPCTFIAVVKPVTTPTQVFFGLGNSASGAPNWLFYQNLTPLWSTSKHDDTTHSGTTPGSVTADTNPHIISWIGTGTTLSINADGVLALNSQSQVQSPTTFNTATLGALSSSGVQSSLANSHLAEVFCWSVSLSLADQAYMRASMSRKYGISST